MYNSNDEEAYLLNGEATSPEYFADDAHSYVEDYDDDDEGYLEFDDDDDDDEAYLEDFEYLDDDDDDDEAYLEYDDDDDEESVDDVLERRRRRRRRRSRRSRFRYRRPRAARGKVFRRSQMRSFRKHGVIRTPAGTAKVKLPANIATKHELKKIDKKVIANNKAVLKNGKAISVVDKNLKSQSSAARRSMKKISRRVGSNKKALEASRQASMLTSMLGSNSLETIKLHELDSEGNEKTGDNFVKTFKVKDSTSDSMASLLPLMMGGSGSSDMSSMLPMIMMANSSSDKDSDDNSSMMMAMAMMMSAKK